MIYVNKCGARYYVDTETGEMILITICRSVKQTKSVKKYKYTNKKGRIGALYIAKERALIM